VSDERGAREEAEDFLQDVLDAGPVACGEVQREAKAAGIAERTLGRAKSRLGVRSRKSSYTGKWEWHLPTPKGA
jgi:hypothetical protein